MAHAQKADLVFQRNEQSIYVVGSNTGWNVIRVKHEDYQQHKWARSFRWKTKSAFCACAITFRFYSNTGWTVIRVKHEDYQQHKWARSFRWKTKSAFRACAITFRFYSTIFFLRQHLLHTSKTWNRKQTIGANMAHTDNETNKVPKH